MRTSALALAVSLALFASASASAQSHDHGGHGAEAQNVETTPADGAAGAAPAAFAISFEHPMRLTALVITPRGGDPNAIAVPDRAPATRISVALPPLAPGTYAFAWTATAADNHIMTGRVQYSVR